MMTKKDRGGEHALTGLFFWAWGFTAEKVCPTLVLLERDGGKKSDGAGKQTPVRKGSCRGKRKM